MLFGNQSRGIRLAVIGYLAAIALGYVLGRTRGHVLVQCSETGPDTKKTKRTKQVKGKVPMKKDEGECHGEKTATKNPEHQVRNKSAKPCIWYRIHISAADHNVNIS